MHTIAMLFNGEKKRIFQGSMKDFTVWKKKPIYIDRTKANIWCVIESLKEAVLFDVKER